MKIPSILIIQVHKNSIESRKIRKFIEKKKKKSVTKNPVENFSQKGFGIFLIDKSLK